MESGFKLKSRLESVCAGLGHDSNGRGTGLGLRMCWTPYKSDINVMLYIYF